MKRAVYLDYAAGAPLRPEARLAALTAMDAGGNPSSVHAVGRRARGIIEDARSAVAQLLGSKSDDVIFTSGAVEANNWAIRQAKALGAGRLFVSALEHPSIEAAALASGLPVERVPARLDGQVDLAWLEARLSDRVSLGGPPVLTLTAACHETGVLQPLQRAGALIKAAGGWMHVDAVAALGKAPLELGEIGAASLAVSGHKIGALAGCGALILGAGAKLDPLILGGGQERGLRAGTENLSGVAAFGAAAKAAARELKSGTPLFATEAADAVMRALVSEGAVLVGAASPRLPAFACLAALGFPAQTQVMALDLEGVMVSAGAACSSGKVRSSPVLQAMGLGGLAGSAIRLSGGWASTPDDYVQFAAAWRSARARFQSRRAVEREVA